MDFLVNGMKNRGRFREVAIVERLVLADVRL